MLKKIAIVGAGGLGREVLGILKSINKLKETWDIIGFYDDGVKNLTINDLRVLGGVSQLNAIQEKMAVVLAIGNPRVKRSIAESLVNSYISFPVILHPNVVIYDRKYVNLGKGVVIGANSVLTTNIKIYDFVYINTATVISHDVSIGEFSILMPNVSISSEATIGKEVYVGNGVKIDYPTLIEDKTVVPIGTVMTNPNS